LETKGGLPTCIAAVAPVVTAAAAAVIAQVLSAAAPAAVACMQRFSVQMLGDLLCSYAEVGIKDEDLLQAAAQVCTAMHLFCVTPPLLCFAAVCYDILTRVVHMPHIGVHSGLS
jgi:hypothetical protein